MNHEHRLHRRDEHESEHAEQLQSQAQGQTQSQAREFESVDALLRADRESLAVPPEIGQRLAQSVAADLASGPRPRRWWERLWGRREES